MCDKYAIEEMTRRLSGREDLIKAMVPTTFEVGCRRPTVSLALNLIGGLFSHRIDLSNSLDRDFSKL